MTALLRHSLPLLGLASALALIGAYTAQYGFGLLPCELCLWQRPAFYAVTGLALLGLFLKKPKLRRILLGLAGVILLANAGLAFYHTGVEQKWWQGPGECTSDSLQAGLSLDELRAKILATPLIRCDEPAWEFHGLTMASVNVIFCLTLSLFAFYAVAHRK